MVKEKSIYLFLLFVLLATACVPSLAKTEESGPSEPTGQPTQSEIFSDDVHPVATSIPSTTIPVPVQETTLELSKDLVRGCDRRDGTDPALQEGDPVVEFSLMDVDGNTFVLSELLKEKPVALIYGSFT